MTLLVIQGIKKVPFFFSFFFFLEINPIPELDSKFEQEINKIF